MIGALRGQALRGGLTPSRHRGAGSVPRGCPRPIAECLVIKARLSTVIPIWHRSVKGAGLARIWHDEPGTDCRCFFHRRELSKNNLIANVENETWHAKFTMNARVHRSNRAQSFGRGGAGNIRKYEDARVTRNSSSEEGAEGGYWRRRSSTWSSRSSITSEHSNTGVWSSLVRTISRRKPERSPDPIEEEMGAGGAAGDGAEARS